MKLHISEHYPKIIRDLFLYDHKEQILTECGTYADIMSGVMHFPVSYPFDYDRNQLLQEAMTLPFRQRQNGVGKCTILTKSSDPIKDEEDMIHEHESIEPFAYHLDNRPAISQFIDNLNIHLGKVTYLSFKTMQPGGFIYPHIDSLCSPVIYHPLHWPQGNHFKWFENGCTNFDNHQPNFINNTVGLHCVINESNQTRISFSFNLDWQNPKAQKFLLECYREITN